MTGRNIRVDLMIQKPRFREKPLNFEPMHLKRNEFYNLDFDETLDNNSHITNGCLLIKMFKQKFEEKEISKNCFFPRLRQHFYVFCFFVEKCFIGGF